MFNNSYYKVCKKNLICGQDKSLFFYTIKSYVSKIKTSLCSYPIKEKTLK